MINYLVRRLLFSTMTLFWTTAGMVLYDVHRFTVTWFPVRFLQSIELFFWGVIFEFWWW
jgi:hypothetical protein